MDTEEKIDFRFMNIGKVERLVGRKAQDMQVKGKRVVCIFAGEHGHADTHVSFKHW